MTLYRIRAVRHRRFLLVGIGLWLLGELLSGPAPYPLLWLSVAGGAAMLVAVATLFPQARYPMLSILVAVIPVRVLADPIAAWGAEALPWAGALAGPLALAAAILLGSRLVALLALPLDRLTLRRPWYSEDRRFIPLPRAQVWRALCLTDHCDHWDPRVLRIVQDLRFPLRFVVLLEAHGKKPARLVLRELDREEGVFQELEAEPVPGVLHGLGPIVAVLLEEVRGGTRVTLTMELQNASLLRLARVFLDAPLSAYALRFRAAMATRRALPAPVRRPRLA